ncbi:MAG: hypothetical protein HC878_09120, partial [Leptolyngbyaceae cyanobacterium SL_5_14]|nr:hypothetical protein [Leptolyngbyaceae cyanobacterium SL_5_14]
PASPDEVEQPLDAIEEGITPESDPGSTDGLEELRPPLPRRQPAQHCWRTAFDE